MKKIKINIPVYLILDDAQSQARLRKAFRPSGVKTIADLCKLSSESVASIKGIGEKTYGSLTAKLEGADLRFGMTEDQLRKYECDAICDRIEEEQKSRQDAERSDSCDDENFFHNFRKLVEDANSRIDASFNALNKPFEEVTLEELRSVACESIDIFFDLLHNVKALSTSESACPHEPSNQ